MPDRRSAVESLLSRQLATPVTIDAWEPVEPWAVARARVSGGASDERVVVKWSRAHPAAAHSAFSLHRTELAALKFLSDDLGLGLTPRVIAADSSEGLIVMEDLSPRTPLDGLLRADGPTVHALRLASFARARGELNAATAGRQEMYYARRAGLGLFDPTADILTQFAGHREKGRVQADAVGAPVTGPAAHELITVLEELAHPGPFLAFSNGDPETNNVLVHKSGAPDPRLIDFEFAGFTHALHDAVCLHVPGPAWMSVDGAFADHYRRALARGVPEAEDDRQYGFALAASCMHYALVRLERIPALDARPVGDDSRAQLVSVMEAAAGVAERALPNLAGWALRTADLLRRRWPDADVDAFPPYTPRRR